MTAHLLTGVRPYGEDPADVLTADGRIAAIGPDAAAQAPAGTVRHDLDGLVALPGLVDIHTHLRQPGGESAETVFTGTRAAAVGGYTAVFAMANTTPVQDSAGVVEQVLRLGREAGWVDVHPVGAVSAGLEGRHLSDMGAMAHSAARVRVFSDDGRCVADPVLMRRALEYVKAFDGVIARDVLLAGHVGSRLHVCHLSTAGSVDIIRWAKARGIDVTAEVTPHHLLLTDELARSYSPLYKVNPPLRTAADVEAVRAALADGTIDVVGTDHAPHPLESKDCEWAAGAFGMTGLETALSVLIETMVAPGRMTWRDLARVMSSAPARIGRLTDQGQGLEVGAPANITVVDPGVRRTVDPRAQWTRSANTPYAGMELPGQVVATFLHGRPTVLAGEPVAREEA